MIYLYLGLGHIGLHSAFQLQFATSTVSLIHVQGCNNYNTQTLHNEI